MSLIGRIRKRTTRLASASGVLFVMLWLALAAAPCAAAMVAPDSGYDCPHCPPPPCDELKASDCDYPDSLDAPRAGEETKFQFAILPAGAALSGPTGFTQSQPRWLDRPIRAGPRIHLRLQRFNE